MGFLDDARRIATAQQKADDAEEQRRARLRRARIETANKLAAEFPAAAAEFGIAPGGDGKRHWVVPVGVSTDGETYFNLRIFTDGTWEYVTCAWCRRSEFYPMSKSWLPIAPDQLVDQVTRWLAEPKRRHTEGPPNG